MPSPLALLLPILLALLELPHHASACCAAAFLVTSLTTVSYPNTTTAAGRYSAAPAANSSITFLVRDPDPTTNATTRCGATWPATAAAPAGWQACENGSFSWRFGDDGGVVPGWTGQADAFGLGVEHTYEDPRVGAPPMDYVTVFGRTAVNASELACRRLPVGGRTCRLRNGLTLEVPIYAAIA